MPMITGGHKTVVHYPDGTSAVITLHALPLEGQIIAHGWEVTSVAPGGDDVAGVPIEYEISVARPAKRVPGARPPAFIVTRIQVHDYDTWRTLFDKDVPRAREKARVQHVYRDVDDPNHVFVFLEFASVEDAQEARRRLTESGVLDRFHDKYGPNVVEAADP